jgi:hypothetical protein
MALEMQSDEIQREELRPTQLRRRWPLTGVMATDVVAIPMVQQCSASVAVPPTSVSRRRAAPE